MLETKAKVKHPQVGPGDRVKVSVKTKEGDKERTQAFSGIVIRVRKGANSANFTVRHIAYGIGVERTFFMNSPFVEKIEIVSQGDVRRARLFYLRGQAEVEGQDHGAGTGGRRTTGSRGTGRSCRTTRGRRETRRDHRNKGVASP
jgi:large subunit ribosomal protein L19